MEKRKVIPAEVLIFGLPLLVILTAVVATFLPQLHREPSLGIAITLDLVLTAPLVYFLMIRKTKIPKITVVPFLVGGVVLGSLLLPADQQAIIGLMRSYVLPVVIFGVELVIGYKIYQTVRLIRKARGADLDIYQVLKGSLAQTMPYPRVAKAMATEFALFYYMLFSWKRRDKAEAEFSHFRESGFTALSLGFAFLIVVETVVLHILIVRWSGTLAWILTILSLYSLVLILGNMKATRQRYSVLDGDLLHLKIGVVGDVIVPVAEVERVELTSRELKPEGKKVEKLGFDTHRVALHFSKPQTVEKLYGIKKKCDVLLLHVDERKAFVAAVEAAREAALMTKKG